MQWKYTALFTLDEKTEWKSGIVEANSASIAEDMVYDPLPLGAQGVCISAESLGGPNQLRVEE